MSWLNGEGVGNGSGIPFFGGGGGGNGSGFGGTPDPLDLFGNRDKAQKKAQEENLAKQNAMIAEGMAKQPGYATLRNPDGSLNDLYAANAAQQRSVAHGGAQEVDITGKTGLDSRMNLNQVKSSDVTAGTIKAGSIADPTKVNAGAQAGNASTDLDRLRSNAFSAAPSAFANAQNVENDRMLAQSSDRLSQNAATGLAQQQSNMAMQGGLDSSARARMGRQAMNAEIMGKQDLYNQNAGAHNQVAMADAQNKQQQQMAMPGMGLQVDQYSTGLQRGNVDAQTQANLANANMSQQASTANVGNNLAAQQFNSQGNLAAQNANNANTMAKANLWSNVAGQNAANKQQASFANAGADNQAAQYNASNMQQANMTNNANLIGDVHGESAFNQNNWQTGMQVMAAQQQAATQQQAQPTGNFFSKLIGGGNV